MFGQPFLPANLILSVKFSLDYPVGRTYAENQVAKTHLRIYCAFAYLLTPPQCKKSSRFVKMAGKGAKVTSGGSLPWTRLCVSSLAERMNLSYSSEIYPNPKCETSGASTPRTSTFD
jgi:hypothetical protein